MMAKLISGMGKNDPKAQKKTEKPKKNLSLIQKTRSRSEAVRVQTATGRKDILDALAESAS